MSRVAIWAQLEAKPGKERELEEFLKSHSHWPSVSTRRLAGMPSRWALGGMASSIPLPMKTGAMPI